MKNGIVKNGKLKNDIKLIADCKDIYGKNGLGKINKVGIK